MKNVPRLISFSGGRSSAMMLKILIDNGLNESDYILFANTGKERPETLDFVRECEIRWSIPIIWIEATFGKYNLDMETMESSVGFRVVSYETASRCGEPYAAMNRWINCKHVPNRNSPFCTKYLKTIPMRRYMLSQGVEDYDEIWGIRYDEPKRWRNVKDRVLLPLVDMKIFEQDVFRFWSQQEFDLQLKTYEGNCDLCLKKSEKKLLTILSENPHLADWWGREEVETGSTFNAVPMTSMVAASKKKFRKAIDSRIMKEEDLFSVSCFCGD